MNGWAKLNLRVRFRAWPNDFLLEVALSSTNLKAEKKENGKINISGR